MPTTAAAAPPDEGPTTAILSLWVPAFIFAHLFAGFWLVRAVLLMNPGWLRSVGFSRGKKGSEAAGGGAAGADDQPERATSLDQRVLAEIADAALAPRAGGERTGGGGCAGFSHHIGAWNCLMLCQNNPAPTHNRPSPNRTHTRPGLVPTSSARLVSSSGGGVQGRSSTGSGRMSVIEVNPVELEWRKLSCSYQTNVGTKWVLEDVYGLAQPGEMQVGAGAEERRSRAAAARAYIAVC
jgi:hypothetical protein